MSDPSSRPPVPDEAVVLNRRYWRRVADDRNRWFASSAEGRLCLDRLRAGSTTLLEGEPAADGSRGEAELLGELSGIDLVHVGCGPGYDSLSWANRGARVVAVDLAEENLVEAGRLARLLGRRLPRVAADARRLPLADDRFSVAYIGGGLIHWIPDLSRLFQELYRVVRPAGRLLVVEDPPIRMALEDEESRPRVAYPYEDQASVHTNLMDRAAWPMPPGTTLQTADYLWTAGAVVTAILQAGFQLQKLLEPRWTAPRPTGSAPDDTRPLLPTALVVLAAKPR